MRLAWCMCLGLKAEFAGAFLYAFFQTIGMAIFFFRAHNNSYENFA